MNKGMQKLLKAINDKKNEVKSLVNDGKLDKAKAAKEELKELQEKFDLLFDLDEEEHEEIDLAIIGRRGESGHAGCFCNAFPVFQKQKAVLDRSTRERWQS